MSFTFKEKPVATIKANEAGTTNQIQIGGVTTGTTTADNAAEQINKIFGVVGKSVSADGMTRVRTEEAVDNG